MSGHQPVWNAAPVRHAVGHFHGPLSLYHETIAPAEAADKPTVLMIHGGGHSGACYQATADGRPGWAYHLAARGYTAIVTDWPGFARSGAVPPQELTGERVCETFSRFVEGLPGPVVVLTHSMGGVFGWKLLERNGARIAAVIAAAPAPPGNIQPVPTIVAESDGEIEIETSVARFRLPKNTDRIVPNRDYVEQKLVGRSRRFPREHLAAYSASVLGTPARLLYERRNVGGSQLRIVDTGGLADTPILLVTGGEDLDHPRALDQATVDWLNAHGARARLLWLDDEGIEGNGHMLMLERNSDQIIALIIDWLDGLPSPT